jgi:hypothetical protein
MVPLTLDEARRRTAILEAVGDDWDPVEMLAEEERAWVMRIRVWTTTSRKYMTSWLPRECSGIALSERK